MLAVGLLPFLAFGLMALLPMLETSSASEDDTDDLEEPIADDLIDDSDEQDDDDSDDPVDPVDPVDPATLGATFETSDDGVTIEFGENETGRLAIFTFVNEDDVGTGIELVEHEARYYLVPEGMDWADNAPESRNNIPGTDTSLEAFEDFFDLTLLGTVDLLAQGNDSPTSSNMSDALPDLIANRDAEYCYLEENTDGPTLVAFVQEGGQNTWKGVDNERATDDLSGSDETDWITAGAEGIVVEGGAGHDLLDAIASDVTIFGDDGDDIIRGEQSSELFGGDGDDEVYGSNNSTLSGGEGNDILNASTSTLFGGNGDDELTVRGVGHEGYGGSGEDTLIVSAHAFGYGGSGNDSMTIEGRGATVFGGDGDDIFNVTGDRGLQYVDPFINTMIISGGEGNDTISIEPGLFFVENNYDVVAQIQDFDPSEDILLIGNDIYGGSDPAEVLDLEITPAFDGSYSDIKITFAPEDNGSSGNRIMTVRVMGNTEITTDHVILR